MQWLWMLPPGVVGSGGYMYVQPAQTSWIAWGWGMYQQRSHQLQQVGP